MRSAETIKFLSFRRTFTRLVLLVVLPSAGLSGFGVVAIINERAAVEKRVESLWRGRLEQVADALPRALGRATAETNEWGLQLRVDGGVLPTTGFTGTWETITSNDPTFSTVLRRESTRLATLSPGLQFFSVAGPTRTMLIAARSFDGGVTGCGIELSAISPLLEPLGRAVTPKGELARLSLQAAKRPAPEGGAAGVLARVAEARQAALGEQPLAALPLTHPFEDITLVVTAVGEDPVAKASWRNRALYVVLLGIFYITLALGIAFTGRTLYREARLSRLKTDFVSLVSHELRTPMTSIRMFIEMLATKRIRDEDELRTVMDLLTKETARLSTLIESVLDFSRLEGGKVRYQLVPTNASAVVARALDALKAQQLGEADHVTVDAPEGLSFLADEEALSGAVLNLLQNAHKYTGQEKRISLRARRVDREVVLEVQDNGVGIARREHRKIFERFYRVDDLLTRQTEGTGLGLSIAQRIVHAHKGRISLDSAVGKGSTFRIHLPAL